MWGIQNSCIGTMGCGDASRIGAEVDSKSYCIGAQAYSKPFALWKLKSDLLYSKFLKSFN
jgi:hypothetical protein